MITIVLKLTRLLFFVLFKFKKILRVSFILPVILSLYSSHVAIAQSNSQGAVPVIWLRGDLGTVSSTFWSDGRNDKWGANAHSGEGPSTNGMLNFNKALVFDGVNHYMKIPYSLEKLPSFTVFAVYQPADTTERGIFGTEKALARKAMLSTKKALGPDEATDKYSESGKIPVLSTIIQSWSESTEIGQEAFLSLGSAGRERKHVPFKGTKAEFLVFDRALNFMERLQVETYLSIKYGIPLANSNYVSADEKVLWHAENNSGFANRITGIGREDAFNLYQKQSVSALDTTRLLALSAGALAPTNADNPVTLNNADYLLWGDNGAPLAESKTSGSEVLLPVLERRWLMNPAGATAQQIETQLQLDLKQLPKSPLGYWLVINRSAQGDFGADKLEYVQADSISADSVAFFRNIKWDIDQSGADQFGFAKARNLLAVLDNIGQPVCPAPIDGFVSMRVIGGKAPYKYDLSNVAGNYHQKWEGENTGRRDQLSAGDYTLQVTDADGYTSVRTFTLQEPEVLLVELGEDRQLKEGEALVLDATVSVPDFGAVTYQWTGSNGFSSTDARVQISEPGEYTLTVTNQNGCVFTDNIYVRGPHDSNFMVYPTIVQSGDSYQIRVSLPEVAGVSVRVYDLKGVLLQEMQGNGQSDYRFKGAALGRGMYMVVLETSGSLSSKKLFVY